MINAKDRATAYLGEGVNTAQSLEFRSNCFAEI